jgi:multicomponent Na+:H+ antiporter subunit E
MRVFLLNVLLMALWIAATAVFTYANALLGFVIGFFVLWWLRPLLGPTTFFRKLPLALWFSLLFLWEVFKANLRVAWDVVTPQKFRKLGIIAIPLDVSTDIEIALLANLITLTPGSLCLDVSPDRRTLFVHEMFVKNPEEVRRLIKRRFEHWVLTLFR